MQHTLRTLTLGLTTIIGTMALAQPAPPYTIIIAGTVPGCEPGSLVNIMSLPNTEPSVDIEIPLGPNCNFDTAVEMTSPLGGFVLTTPCNGALVTATGEYLVNFLGTDTVFVEFDCGPVLDCEACIELGPVINQNGNVIPFAVVGANCSQGASPITFQIDWGDGVTNSSGDHVFDEPGTYGVCITIADGSGCTSVACDTVVVDANGGITVNPPPVYDCLQIPNGPNVPGSPCTNPNGSTGTWNANCECVPNTPGCEACIELGPVINQSGNAIPFAVLGANCSQGTAPITYQINWGDGVINSSGDHAYATPGIYGVCITIADGSGCTSVACDTVVVDANGGITVNPPPVYDCLQIPNGPNVPGSPCTDPATGVTGTWSATCDCIPNTPGDDYDCLGVLNGSNLPGTPCWTPGTNFIGVWDDDCNCSSGSGLPCQAGFWVIQAYGQDSVPVPNEVWVWNLSTGNGALSYLWDFGDGTTSTDPFPTHTYEENGPYLLCLTIADASGCTSTTCDTVSIDENGLLNGMIIGGHAEVAPERNAGFTLNVHNPLTTSIFERQDLSQAAIWPNPSSGDLDLALVAAAEGSLGISFIDVNGREVRQESRTMHAGRSQHRFDITDLPAGLYTLRATDRNGNSIRIRFVKAD